MVDTTKVFNFFEIKPLIISNKIHTKHTILKHSDPIAGKLEIDRCDQNSWTVTWPNQPKPLWVFIVKSIAELVDRNVVVKPC